MLVDGTACYSGRSYAGTRHDLDAVTPAIAWYVAVASVVAGSTADVASVADATDAAAAVACLLLAGLSGFLKVLLNALAAPFPYPFPTPTTIPTPVPDCESAVVTHRVVFTAPRAAAAWLPGAAAAGAQGDRSFL